jgi:hypothetical protein
MTDSVFDSLPVCQRLVIEACLRTSTDFLWRGPSELLVSQVGASRVIADLGRNDQVVIGVDGFDVHADGIVPRLDLIYDGEHGVGDVATVIAEWPPKVWVELVLKPNR